MAKIAIVTDTMSGLTKDEAKSLGVRIIPMPFIVDGKEYFEGINLERKEFFNMLENDLNVSTSQPSIYAVREVWDELLQEYDCILHIPMSSGLSMTYEMANNEANTFYQNKVYVVDNKRISVTLRQSVIDAKELVDLNYSAKEIKEILESVRSESRIYLMLDTLKYLKKGGRITKTAAALGGMLKIKPILIYEGEKLDKFRMRNRTIENGIDIMLDAIKRDINGFLKEIDGEVNNVKVGIAYTDSNKDKIEYFKSKIREQLGNIEIVDSPLALSIACHTGDGALGIGITKDIPLKYTNKKYIELKQNIREELQYK